MVGYLRDYQSPETGTEIKFKVHRVTYSLKAQNMQNVGMPEGAKQISVFTGQWQQAYKFSVLMDSIEFDKFLALLKSGGNHKWLFTITWEKEDGSGNYRSAVGYITDIQFKFENAFMEAIGSPGTRSASIVTEFGFVVNTENIPSGWDDYW